MYEIENEICKRCKAKDSIIEDYQSGERVCENCGLVYEENIIADEDEKRTFQDDEHEIHRVGPPVKPIYGNELGTDLLIVQNGKKKIIKTYSKHNKIQRNYSKIQKFLSQATENQLIIEITKELYDQVSKNMKMQGRNIKLIIMSLLYYAYRKQQCAKTFKEIVEMFGIEDIKEKHIKRTFNKLKYYINEPNIDEHETNLINEMNLVEKNYVESFVGDNKERFKLKLLSEEIIDNLHKGTFLEGKSPKTIAGLSLFLSCKLLNDNLSEDKEFFSKFSNKNTLKKSFKEIKDSLEIIIPQEHVHKIQFLNEKILFI